MFRVLFLAATAAALAGCAGSESATQARFRVDDAKCKNYGAEHELSNLLQKILETVLRLLGADRGAVLLFDPATGRTLLRMARTRSGGRERWVLTRSIIDEVVSQRSGVISGDAGHFALSVLPSKGRTSITRARPQVCSSGTFSVVTSLWPRGPYWGSNFFSSRRVSSE